MHLQTAVGLVFTTFMIEKLALAAVFSIIVLVSSWQGLLLFTISAVLSYIARMRLSTLAVMSGGTVLALIVGVFFWVATQQHHAKRVSGDEVFSHQDYVFIGSPVFSTVAGLLVLTGFATGLLLNILYKRISKA